MSKGAELHDFQILNQLRNALTKYQENASSSISSFEAELQNTLNWLEERVRARKKEYTVCQERVSQSINALAKCRSLTKERDQYNLCQREELEVRKAERSLEEARTHLEIAQKAILKLQKEVESFRSHSQKTIRNLESAVASGKKLLSQKEQVLSSYSGMGGHVSGPVQAPAMGEVVVSSAEKGSEFERWARENVFHGMGKRLVIDLAINTHLDEYGDGVGITKEKRITDAFLSRRGEIWDLKSGYEKGGIDVHQLDEYSMMERAGHVWVTGKDGRSVKKNVRSINYLFDSEAGARANASVLRGYATVWYMDKDKNVQLFKE